MRLLTPGLSGRAADLGPRVGHRALDLLLDRLRVVEDEDGPLLGPARRGHLPRRLLQVHDPRPDLGDPVLGDDEDVLAVARVEAPRDVAHELEVLALVLADRDLVGAVGEHVGGLEDGIEEQPGGHELALGERLVAELVHAVELADRRDRRQQPAELGVLVDVGLAEEDAALRVEAGGDQDRGRVVQALAQLGGLVGDGDRVEVDDAVDRRVAAVLAVDVLADRADVVAEVLAAGGLDAGEDAHEADECSGSAAARRIAGPPLRSPSARGGLVHAESSGATPRLTGLGGHVAGPRRSAVAP